MARDQPDYWAGWMDGWAAATNAIVTAQHHAAGPEPRPKGLEISTPATAGDKPSKRGRPPKPQALAAPPLPRKRGRPPKNRQD